MPERRHGGRPSPGRSWRSLAVAGAAVGLLVPAVGAVADTTTREDPKDDVQGVPAGEGFDLRAATAAHGSSGRVVHRISSHYPDPPGFAAVRLEFDTTLSDRRHTPDFHVRKAGSGAAIYDHRGRRVGRATFARISDARFSLSFRLSAMGNPPRYGWRVRIAGEGDATIDKLPDRGYVRHTMPRPDD